MKGTTNTDKIFRHARIQTHAHDAHGAIMRTTLGLNETAHSQRNMLLMQLTQNHKHQTYHQPSTVTRTCSGYTQGTSQVGIPPQQVLHCDPISTAYVCQVIVTKVPQ